MIAAGAKPARLEGLAGAEHAITSNEAFDLAALPKRIAIIGGGYIAVEFAGIFNGLGVETALCYRGAEILRGFDAETAGILREEMGAKGVEVRLHAVPREIVPLGGGGGYRVAF